MINHTTTIIYYHSCQFITNFPCSHQITSKFS